MFKKVFSPFITSLSLGAAIIVVLFSCTVINQSFEDGGKSFALEIPSKHPAEKKYVVENIDPLFKWPH